MHIILGLLGTVVTILVLLNRLADAGIDLGGLNPYLWSRRRKWQKQYEGNPLFKIESPLDATGVLCVAVAKADGDMSKEDKQGLLNLFENELHLSKKDAAGLLISSAHLLGDGAELRGKVENFLAPSKPHFSEDQARSAIVLVTRVAGDVSLRHPNAIKLLNDIELILTAKAATGEVWP